MAQRRHTAARALFLRHVRQGVGVTWPILSALLSLMAGLGALIGLLEGWGIPDGIYFAFVTGLTIGYGELVPSGPLTRLLAITVGILGISFTAIIAAVAVAALRGPAPPGAGRKDDRER